MKRSLPDNNLAGICSATQERTATFFVRACLLLLVVLVATGYSAKAETPPLARVADKAISFATFQAKMKQGRGNSISKETVLQELIDFELVYQVAQQDGLDHDPEILANLQQMIVSKYRQIHLEPLLAGAKISDSEIEIYYQTHLDDFSIPASDHIALIRINVSSRASEEKKAERLKRAKKARAEAVQMESGVPAFGSLALSYSEDQNSRYRGGDIGWLQVGTQDGRWDPKVSEAIALLKTPGQISPVIIASDAYYVVKLIERKAARIKPLSQVTDGVRYSALREKKQQIDREFIQQLRNATPVRINHELLQTLDGPVEENNGAPPQLPAY